ncbi:hypothetical protein ND747_19285, partial [Frankia sp. R82]|nr:hypothetical protein [Frankia sp. R82]
LGWRPRVGFEELVAMMVDNDLALESAAAAWEDRLPTPLAAPRPGESRTSGAARPSVAAEEVSP